MTNLRIALLVATIGALIVTMGSYAQTEAKAHTITKKTCKQVASTFTANLNHPSLKAWRYTLKACTRYALRHAKQHARRQAIRKCLAVKITGMGHRVCAAFVDAAATVKGASPPWAYSPALHSLLASESGGDPNAVNDSSDACGLGQRLVSGKHIHRNGGRGCPWGFSVVGYSGHRRIERLHVAPIVQAKDMLRYIVGRYGSPSAALGYHRSVGWY